MNVGNSTRQRFERLPIKRLAVVTLLVAGCATPVHSAPSSGTILFACSTAQGRLVARDAGGGRVIVSLPRAPTAALRSLASRPHPSRHASAGYSGGGETQLQVPTATGTFVLYERTVRINFTPGEPNDPAFSAGAALISRGKRTLHRACREDSGFKADASKGRPEGKIIDIAPE
jgi:hypothetical protein